MSKFSPHLESVHRKLIVAKLAEDEALIAVVAADTRAKSMLDADLEASIDAGLAYHRAIKTRELAQSEYTKALHDEVAKSF